LGVEKMTLLANSQHDCVFFINSKLLPVDIVTCLNFFSTVLYLIANLIEKVLVPQRLNFSAVPVQNHCSRVKWTTRNYDDEPQKLSWRKLVNGWSDKILVTCFFRNSKPGWSQIFINAPSFSPHFIKQSVGPCITK